MKPKLLLLLSGLTLVLAADARANLAFVLAPAVQSGVGSNQVIFAAALTNASPTDALYLNDLQLSFNGGATNYLAAGTNLFFCNVPGILQAGETYTDIVFGVALNPAIPPGNYSGTATVRGGSDIFATSNLASQTFQVTLSPAALRLAVAGTNCVLSWPSPPAGFVLQQNSDLTGANWVTVTNTPAVSNGWNTVFFSPKGHNYFYRLTYP
ncbi:MAG TPA: hypothetical protein VK815_06315 [Candidatus Acidoferrales bacterium]|jgi:hypothetical protein|nr:hypothetical protein [Candidatus Acidoferrales bacterium]